MSTSQVIEIAQNLDEIGFPEFTSQLVSDTFQTLVGSQIEQLEAYAELVRETSKTVTEYVAENKDNVSGAKVLERITKLLHERDLSGFDPNATTVFAPVGTEPAWSQTDVDILNDGLAYDQTGPGLTTASTQADIAEAARKWAASEQQLLLQEIIRLGLIRLVVTDGTIESRLSFQVAELQQSRTAATQYASSNLNAGLNFGFARRVFRMRGGIGYNKIKVSTNTSSSSSSLSTNVNISGLVRINFRSDFQSNA